MIRPRGHCWMGRREFLGLDPPCPHGGHDPDDWEGAMECVEGGLSATCMLEEGHPGEHEWTPDSEIMLVFR